MKTLLLPLALAATTAFAQSPDSVSGMIYEEATHVLGAGFRFVTVASLQEGGSYSTVVREHYLWLSNFNDPIVRFVDESDAGTFHYQRTDSHTATLTFTSANGTGVMIRNLEFESGNSGYFTTGASPAGRFILSKISCVPIVNASARGTASASKPLILGFCVPEPYPRYVLVRAVGPGLSQFDVTDAAEDTTLEIFGKVTLPPGAEMIGFRNDDWEVDHLHMLSPGASSLTTTVGAFLGAFPLAEGSKDAALTLKFSPGAYTVVIRTKSETPAEVLGEVYVVP
jgi:hypothetical protein